MMNRVSALIAGVLFGMGMMLSGMIDPHKVLGFLDITGAWDPSLAFVMGGALLVFMPVYFLVIRRRQQPVCETSFSVSTNTVIDKRLIAGASLFGVGWGLAGICPGPAVTSLPSQNGVIVVFLVAMLVGMSLVNRYDQHVAVRQKTH
ncbi:DUF6691 family protein [Photobacterium aphoticum]|uniref:Transporter n=1 Tax=Photobacterium aphoticum TaxID=754436 RepID=A0A0J1GTY7_9GAMM|nr:transporter [Photobacterium aphoticum]GHA51856.1 transporter [Photobacterium aphoticum]